MAPVIKHLFHFIVHIIHPRFFDIDSKLDSVQMCRQAHSNKIWVIKSILKTDEGWELNFVVIFKSENEVEPESSPKVSDIKFMNYKTRFPELK